MKIKYRRFDENGYTEVECDNFIFHLSVENETELNLFASDGEIYRLLNVCEVYIEEI